MGRLPAQSRCHPGGGLQNRLADEQGVTLIETLVSAVILVVVIGAVLTTIDVSSRTTANNRSRSVAASLAEQDQERLRGLSATALSNYSLVTNQAVDGNEYTVTSDSDWVYDATGSTASCSNATTQANYLRISSSVTSAIVGTRIKPVVIRSLVAPRVGDFGANQGTLAVLVKNQLNGPVTNMPVTITGPYNGTEYTNEFGCAVFGHIPIGDYAATLNQAGWVDNKRIQVSNQNTAVSDGNTTAIQMSYAMASAIEVSFETKVGAAAPQAARGHALTVANASIPAQGIDPPGVVTFPSPTAPAPALMIPALSLYPFPDGYTAYAGDCAANDPAKYDTNYFASFPGFTNVTPGATAAVTVREPAFNVQTEFRLNGAAPVLRLPGARVKITLTSPGCAAATSIFDFTSDLVGRLPEPGMPFGTYTACVDDSKAPLVPGQPRKQEVTGIANTGPDGLALESDGVTPQLKLRLDYSLSGGSPLGVC